MPILFPATIMSGYFPPIDYLVVAGGGGGGSVGGGGGGGGVLPGFILNTAQSYSVTVGSGGAGGVVTGSGGTGGSSALGAISASGGGGGGANSGNGLSGGSGGGAGAVGSTGGAGTVGQGFAGGASVGAVSPYPPGGGGGAGGAGVAGSGSTAGAGGVGYSSSISGSSYIYGAGGGGCGTTQGASAGAGGSGGHGGAGSLTTGGASSYYGGGGGGGGNSGGNNSGGAGCQGVVIVRYLGPQVGYGGTVTSAGGYTIHTFTSSGSFSFLAPITVSADSPILSYTDSVAPSFVGGYARFQRPEADDGSGYVYCMPGGRLRFRSNAPTVNVGLRWNGLVTRTDARNLIGHVYIDGVYNRDFQTPAGVNVVTTSTLTLSMGSSVDRLYEIILPYADGVEFGSVTVDALYTVTSATRTGSRMVCMGDSITQGFWATDVRRTWPFLLAQAKGFQCINMGTGGRTATAADGTVAANLSPDLIIVLYGMNEYLSQIPVATYKANLKALLSNIHAVNPTVPVYISALTLSTASLAIPIADYRAVAGECITELGYSQLVGVDTSLLIPNSSYLNADGVHPNDTGHANMASVWGSAIT